MENFTILEEEDLSFNAMSDRRSSSLSSTKSISLTYDYPKDKEKIVVSRYFLKDVYKPHFEKSFDLIKCNKFNLEIFEKYLFNVIDCFLTYLENVSNFVLNYNSDLKKSKDLEGILDLSIRFVLEKINKLTEKFQPKLMSKRSFKDFYKIHQKYLSKVFYQLIIDIDKDVELDKSIACYKVSINGSKRILLKYVWDSIRNVSRRILEERC